MKRDRPLFTTTLSKTAIAAVTELARQQGLTRSAVVEVLIRREASHMGMDLEELGRAVKKKRKARKKKAVVARKKKKAKR